MGQRQTNPYMVSLRWGITKNMGVNTKMDWNGLTWIIWGTHHFRKFSFFFPTNDHVHNRIPYVYIPRCLTIWGVFVHSLVALPNVVSVWHHTPSVCWSTVPQPHALYTRCDIVLCPQCYLMSIEYDPLPSGHRGQQKWNVIVCIPHVCC